MDKKYKYQITTKVLTVEQLKRELIFFVEYFEKQNVNTCEIMFGYAWGLEYYQDDWLCETTSINTILDKIKDLEQKDMGSIGDDDFFIYIENIEFLFCHECDVHMSYSEHNSHISYFLDRWKNLNYRPLNSTRRLG